MADMTVKTFERLNSKTKLLPTLQDYKKNTES